MKSIFLEKLDFIEKIEELYNEESANIINDCINLYIQTALLKRVKELNLFSLDKTMSVPQRLNYIHCQKSLLKIGSLLSEHNKLFIGNGDDKISVAGIEKLIERNNYKKAFDIISRLANSQEDLVPSRLFENIESICLNEDIEDIENIFVNSWLYKNEKDATRIVKCIRPGCGAKYHANYQGKYCNCGAELEEHGFGEPSFISSYVKDIVKAIKVYC